MTQLTYRDIPFDGGDLINELFGGDDDLPDASLPSALVSTDAPTTPTPHPSTRTPDSERAFRKRWKHEELFADGYVGLPITFLRHYATLPQPLTSGEALFVIHLMQFKWDEKAPFPGYKKIAQQMGVSDKMVRRHAQSLEIKGYLKREKRIGRTNRFHLTTLFDAILDAVFQGKKG